MCAALESSSIYRTRQREVLYEAPSVGSFDYISPWTSSGDVRDLLREQFNCVQGLGFVNEGDRRHNSTCVQVLSRMWLQSYVEDDQFSVEGGSLLDRDYGAAKELCIPLIQDYVSSEAALQASIEHKYFGGIVRLCEEQQGNNTVSGHISATLVELMSASSPLHNYTDSDNRTFPEFVLKYYADREQFANVLDIGQHCPSELQTILQQDPRLRDYLWINDIRQGRFDQGAQCLQKMVTEAPDQGTVGREMLDASVLQSLQKLASKVSAK
jgi:hypothetical protein